MDERFETVLPGPRPFLGPSLAGGDRSLLDPPTLAQEDGHPNRIVNHVPFDDVDVDGVDDVLELDLDLREGVPMYGFTGVLRINTLSGGTGRQIGRYEMDFHSGAPFLAPARVGPRGVPGVIIFLDRFLSNADNPTRALEVIAVTGKGRELWTRRWVSTWTSTPSRFVAATGFAAPTGLLEHRGRRATDILLGVYDYAAAVISMTPVVVAGADGSVIEHERVSVAWLETTPIPIPAPDLDGDRRQDTLIIDTNGLGQGLRANSSTSGEELWHNSDAPSGSGTVAADVGTVTGDRTRDIVLGEPVRLVDGATGEVQWEREGGAFVVSYGDVDGDGRADVLASDGFFHEKRFGADVDVVNSRGRSLGKRRYVAPRSEPGFSWIIQEDAGDTNGDGIGDAFLHLLHYGEGETVERRSVIDAATSAPLHRGGMLFALNGSLMGGTDDLVNVRHAQSRVSVTARTGHLGKPIWTARASVPKSLELAFHPRAAGGRQGRRDVVMTFFNRRSARALLLDGRTGRRLWSRVLRPTEQ